MWKQQILKLFILISVFDCLIWPCGAGPNWQPTFEHGHWPIQSASFAASILNVRWLYNTRAEKKQGQVSKNSLVFIV